MYLLNRTISWIFVLLLFWLIFIYVLFFSSVWQSVPICFVLILNSKWNFFSHKIFAFYLPNAWMGLFYKKKKTQLLMWIFCCDNLEFGYWMRWNLELLTEKWFHSVDLTVDLTGIFFHFRILPQPPIKISIFKSFI